MVSWSLRRSYTGCHVTLPKATINSWLHRIQMFIFARLKYNDTSFSDTIVPLAHVGITARPRLDLPRFGRKSVPIKFKQLLNRESLGSAVRLPVTLTQTNFHNSNHSRSQILDVRANRCNILPLSAFQEIMSHHIQRNITISFSFMTLMALEHHLYNPGIISPCVCHFWSHK